MTESENPIDTLVRLVSSLIYVVKDNAAVASLLVTQGNYDRELLKGYDGQITLSQSDGGDERLSTDGRLRREFALVKLGVYTVDKAMPGSDPGKVMRDKIGAEIKRIIRDYRNLPYQTTYSFNGLGYPSGDPHKASDATAATELVPSSTSWAELSVANYEKIWSSDDVRHSKSTSVRLEYALMLFKLKLAPREQCIKSIVLSFEGYGTAPDGDGVALLVWNHVTSVWEHGVWNIAASDETLTLTLSSGIMDHVDSNGYVYFLARTRMPYLWIKHEACETGDNAYAVVHQTAWKGQTFTPDVAHTIIAVGLKLSKFGNPTAPIAVSIRATDGGGKPVGADLCSGTLDPALIPSAPDGDPGAWYMITLGAGCPLSLGVKYAIILHMDGGDPANEIQWRMNTDAPYAGGNLCYSGNGTTWYSASDDTMFAEYSAPAAPAILYCDYMQCVIQVQGITHVNFQSFRNILVTDVKPYLYSTEFLLKAWLIVTLT